MRAAAKGRAEQDAHAAKASDAPAKAGDGRVTDTRPGAWRDGFGRWGVSFAPCHGDAAATQESEWMGDKGGYEKTICATWRCWQYCTVRGSGQGSSSVVFPKRIRAYLIRVYIRTLEVWLS